MFRKLTALLSFLSLATAHFSIEYPYWRGSSFEGDASQWISPCANVNSTPESEANRTLWPVTGGSLRLHVTHPWALTYVNLGLAEGTDGNNNTIASFNASLLATYNQTGNGTFCLPQLGGTALEELAREAGIEGGVTGLDGRNASLQVVQIGHGGSALYNCADITFSSNASTLAADQCSNSTGVGGIEVTNVGSEAAAGGSASSSASSADASATATGAASGGKDDHMAGKLFLAGLGLLLLGL
ncbi:hypothetical protein DIS24_g6581 [Lasiodiplodia hormozganensis]|uniref:Copper acquisition factor BIM1-like domain-containing protein n=1 Tax=Lasiodiplodia hormozganensis TaxID=869390 RepID=A0AA39YDM0_9PEZI|nr:hypothetical protein DIS24_g6581 [Lasiodiplodia hormozganensis]